ncbi:CHL4-domain-containing protein [Parathielavia appendiculata]|uniref:CHL4-domain-containing protein n=1 Tax=Parathielavia appendiculata TaxID=2587402 RepID=A0AAN6TSU9_9PEZI|nr:CHL4-domain-containing protein [Parathielavia appendiculata]
MPRISVPTTARLPSALRVDSSNPAVTKILSRLSRSSLLSVALDWLDDNNFALAQPYLREDENDDEEADETDGFYPPARSPEALRDLYISLQARKGSKREVLDRITEGDWRHGLTLYQLAMADLQYLYDHPTSQKWSAYRVTPLKAPTDPDGEEPPQIDTQSLTIPRFHPSTFLKTLQAQVLPDVKAHYTFDPHQSLPLLLLRIFILDSPYNTSHALQRQQTNNNNSSKAPPGTATGFDASRTVYIAFPDASPQVFISKPESTTPAGGGGAAGESKSLRNLLVEGIPKALSRPLQRQRFTLQSTNLVTRNLAELVQRRGGGRTNSAGGGWSIYADESGKKRETPLDLLLPSPPLSGKEGDEVNNGDGGKRRAASGLAGGGEEEEERAAKRARLVALARFGGTAVMGDGKGVERVDVVVEDTFPAQQNEPAQTWRPHVRLTFHGPHVFAGIRQLVECGIIDGERMPGWMTGEEGVTIGTVRNGRIRGHKGSGL